MVMTYLISLSGWSFALVTAAIILVVELIVHTAIVAADRLQSCRRF